MNYQNQISGDVEPFTYDVQNDGTSSLSVNVAEETKGKSSMNYFNLKWSNGVSRPIPKDPSAVEVGTTLYKDMLRRLHDLSNRAVVHEYTYIQFNI